MNSYRQRFIMSNAKESESHYEVIEVEKVYEYLPTGFEEVKKPTPKTFFSFLNPNKIGKSKEPKDRYPPDNPMPTNKRNRSLPPLCDENYKEVNMTTDKPQITSNSRSKPDPVLSTKEQSPSLVQADINVRKVNPKQPDVIPPMRRTISHSAVHSHKHTILAPEFQDIIPEPPKRDQSLGVKVTKQPIPSPVQPKEETKAKPNSKENYHTETNPTHQATQNYIQNNKNTLPKIPPKSLRRTDSTPNKIRTTEQTNHNLKDRAKSMRRPPTVLAKPKLSRSTTKELIEEKSTTGEGKERTIQDLETHLKEFKIISSIEPKSYIRKQNFYQESPSKVVN